MKIRLEQQYIGAAVMQIAEHPQFTAVNTLKIKGHAINNAFLVNNDISVFCKYCSEPNGNEEYAFTFNREHLANIDNAQKGKHKLFFAFVCVEESEICCLTEEQLTALIQSRKKSAKADENQYQILVTAKKGSSFRVYVNAAGKKGKTAGKMLTIARNAFPDIIFG